MKMFRSLSVEPSSRFPIARWAPIPLRVVVGYSFMEHGVAKLSKGPHAFVAIVQAMGVPDPHFMAWLTILTELLGGFAVILGAFVAIVSLPMAIVLLVAMFKVHHPYGFSSVKLLAVTASGAKFGPPGYGVNLLYLACRAALVLGGSGPFALDKHVRINFAVLSIPLPLTRRRSDDSLYRKIFAYLLTIPATEEEPPTLNHRYFLLQF